MKVAVVGGAGRWGANIVRTLPTLPGTEVAWVAGSRDDWRAWLKDLRPDAVAIASPASLHAEHVLAVLGAGLPVFVEKPLALSTPDAERVRDLAAARKLAAVVDHVHLFNPAWRAVKAAAESLGGPRAAVSAAGNAGPFRADVTPLWDWGAHDVALALDLFGTPTTVEAELEADGNDRVRLGFSGGWSWQARVGSRFADRTRTVRVTCARGEVVWDDLATPKVTAAGAAVAADGEAPLTAALRAFLAAAAGGAAAPSDAAFGTEVVRVLSRCGPSRPA